MCTKVTTFKIVEFRKLKTLSMLTKVKHNSFCDYHDISNPIKCLNVYINDYY